MKDVFISYEHESINIADSVRSQFEKNGIECWMAPRDVDGDYATSIVKGISNAKIFVLVLSGAASTSNQVLNEVETAYKKDLDIKIMPLKVDDKPLSQAMEYYIQRIHWIDAVNHTQKDAIQELLEKAANSLGVELKADTMDYSAPPSAAIRSENKYFKDDDSDEKRRLRVQNELVKFYDMKYYDKALLGKENVRVLDIGSNCGDQIMGRMEGRDNIAKVIGLEFEENAVAVANANYGSDDVKFYQCDVEAKDFHRELDRIMEENGIDAFDFINISHLIIHLKNPYKMMRILRQHMSERASVLIEDPDDGLDFAYPDPDGAFARVARINSENETAGFRYSGRQVYTLLKKCGMRTISLESPNYTTIGMNFQQRQATFETNFSYILPDLQLMVDKYPDNQKLRDDLEWLTDIYDDLEERFHSEEFVYSSGLMIYLASN